MKKRYYRYFGGLITLQEKWLNKMAKKGFRLVKTGKLLYEFECCKPNQFQYAVEFIAEKTKLEADNYKAFLENCGYNVFYKNINLNYSLGKIRFRPWTIGSGKIATNSTTFNKELLIVEKENNGNPFELHTTTNDKIKYLKNWRNIWLTYFSALVIMGIVFAFKTPLVSIILGGAALLLAIPTLIYQIQINKLKKQMQIEE